MTEHDIDKVLESDGFCAEDADDSTVEQHEFCIDDNWISPEATGDTFARYDDADEQWGVLTSSRVLTHEASDALDLRGCSAIPDDEDARQACEDCRMY